MEGKLMSTVDLLLKGPQALDHNVYQHYQVVDPNPKEAFVEQIKYALSLWFNKEKSFYVPLVIPGKIDNVTWTELGWKDCNDETGFYRVNNQIIVQGKTKDERNSRAKFWTEMKSKMCVIQMAAGGSSIVSIILSVVLLAKMSTPICAAALLVIALASLMAVKIAKTREVQAAEAAKMCNDHPGTWAIKDRQAVVASEPQPSAPQLTDVRVYAAMLTGLSKK